MVKMKPFSRLGDRSQKSEDVHVRFSEGVGVRFPCATQLQVYIGGRRSAERVIESLALFFIEEKLKPKVNWNKGASDKAWKRSSLGSIFYVKPKGRIGLRLASKTLQKVKDTIRKLTSRNRPWPMKTRIRKLNEYLQGWIGYYCVAAAKSHLKKIKGWMRRRLRMRLWKQWKRICTRLRKLRGLDLKELDAKKVAFFPKAYCAVSKTRQLHQAVDNSYWLGQGLNAGWCEGAAGSNPRCLLNQNKYLSRDCEE